LLICETLKMSQLFEIKIHGCGKGLGLTPVLVQTSPLPASANLHKKLMGNRKWLAGPIRLWVCFFMRHALAITGKMKTMCLPGHRAFAFTPRINYCMKLNSGSCGVSAQSLAVLTGEIGRPVEVLNAMVRDRP
jgi:hypothetical protein